MVRETTKITSLELVSPETQDLYTLLELGRKIYGVTKNPADVNKLNLERLLDKGLNYDILRETYSTKKEQLERTYDLKVPLIALFRAEVIGQPIEQHPIIIAREAWPNFQANSADWQRFVTLPVKIGIKEAELLGIILADTVSARTPSDIRLYGNEKSNFYEQIVSPLIKEIFNLPTPVHYRKRRGQLPNSKGELKTYSWQSAEIELCSRVLRTWLDHDLGFPNLSEILEHLPEKRQKLALLEGYIAGKAGAYTYPVSKRCNSLRNKLCLHHNDKNFAQSFVELAKSLGIKVYGPYGPYKKNRQKVRYEINICDSNIDNLHLLNPWHREKFDKA